MQQFDYEREIPGLMTPSVVASLGDLREHRGKQSIYLATKPDALERLCEVAKIQSTGASNRIENIATSDNRLRDLMLRKVEPKNRDEREIAGYRYVLDLIHSSYDDIPVTPNVILQLHRELYRFQDVSFAGRWKDSDNVIAERDASGKLVARFRPTSAAATPGAVERLCESYAEELKRGGYDPIIASLLFTFDFVSIHPFTDGNGRMSRLLTLLVLYRSGYTVGKYISIEAEIEKTKETYYEALAASSIGWEEASNDYLPYLTYMLGIVTSCYKMLDERYALLSSDASSEDVLRRYFDALTGAVSKREIAEANPAISKRTIERALQKMQAEGLVEKVGAARATRYRRIR